MTANKIREMPRDHCLLFLESYKPIYDEKNLPFATEVWKESERLAGKHGYRNQVYVYENIRRQICRTIECPEQISVLTRADFAFYQEIAAKDDRVKTFEINEEQFLYLNLHEEPALPDPDVLKEIVAKMKVSKAQTMEVPEDVKRMQMEKTQEVGPETIKEAVPEEPVPKDRKDWDLSGTILDCLKRYAKALSIEQQDIIVNGMEDGLSDAQIKEYFLVEDVEKMQMYERVLRMQNKG